jgi:hypothetical protein
MTMTASLLIIAACRKNLVGLNWKLRNFKWRVPSLQNQMQAVIILLQAWWRQWQAQRHYKTTRACSQLLTHCNERGLFFLFVS